MKNQKVLATISMIQPRIAIGDDQSGHTTLHLMQGIYYGSDEVELFSDDDARDLARAPLCAQEVGTVEIVHPAIMWGTSEEILGDMIRAAYRRLEADGIIYDNGYGVYFIA